MKIIKSQRNFIYTHMQYRPHVTGGLCIALYFQNARCYGQERAMDMEKDTPRLFPELYLFRPSKNKVFWWNNNEAGKNARLLALAFMIAMTK